MTEAEMMDLETSEDSNGWVIKDDQMAEWAILKIKEAQNDLEKWKRYYTAMIAKVQESTDSTVAFMTAKLQEYFRMVPHKETKTQSKYSLPSGDLVEKKPKEAFVHDDAKLLEWLAQNGITECIQTVEKVKWADLKKRLVVNPDGSIADSETGLICSGVEVVTEDSKFAVSLND